MVRVIERVVGEFSCFPGSTPLTNVDLISGPSTARCAPPKTKPHGSIAWLKDLQTVLGHLPGSCHTTTFKPTSTGGSRPRSTTIVLYIRYSLFDDLRSLIWPSILPSLPGSIASRCVMARCGFSLLGSEFVVF